MMITGSTFAGGAKARCFFFFFPSFLFLIAVSCMRSKVGFTMEVMACFRPG